MMSKLQNNADSTQNNYNSNFAQAMHIHKPFHNRLLKIFNP